MANTELYQLTLKSSNKKTGAIPVSTSPESTCPDICPFKSGGCYAKSGPLALHWNKVSVGHRGVSWNEFLNQIRSFPADQLWRHNQAGDLPGTDKRINARKLRELVSANDGKKGYTYTHYSMGSKHNRDQVLSANHAGFIVNLSANNLKHADELKALRIAPVVTVLPSNTTDKHIVTPNGHTVMICPATYRDTSCSECTICANRDRSFIVGFPAHGTSKKKADLIAISQT
ncbi:MAG: hypothetical protein QF704_09480 [Anaerolineales bacterium]|nr:hypothetical protein [Anaerolineales bacterium]MDP6770912.1 hypothetical protein [Anaerolineales bacterium]